MTRATRLARLAVMCAAPWPAATAGPAACLGPAVAEMPLLDAGDRSAVPVTLNGTPSALVVDTGATHTALAASAAARLGLSARHLDHAVLSGIGGVGARDVADLRELGVAGLRFEEFNVPVVAFELPPAGPLATAGVLGASVLSRFDVDLDFPGRRLRLRLPAPCAPLAPGWRPVWSRLPLTSEPGNLEALLRHGDVMTVGTTLSVYRGLPYPDHARLFTLVWVNLRPMVALVDTGASVTALTPEAAARAGLPGGGAPVLLTGVGEAPLDGRLVSARVRVGADDRAGMLVAVADMDVGRADMILGRDLMQGRRILLAYESREMIWQAPEPAR